MVEFNLKRSMKKVIDQLSVFFPSYNEEANIEKTLMMAREVLLDTASEWEIIVVNDGSRDRTGEIAERLSKSDKRIRVVTHSPNRGYGAAFKSGFYSARFPWIAFTDADGQFDFSEITKLIAKQKETKADLVIGYYLKRQVSLLRKLNSFLWQLVVFLLFGLKVKDIDCGFKLVSKKVIDKIPKLESERGPFISSEFLIKAKKSGFKIVEVGVHHYPRKAGTATGAQLRVIIHGFIDLFRLWKKLR